MEREIKLEIEELEERIAPAGMAPAHIPDVPAASPQEFGILIAKGKAAC